MAAFTADDLGCSPRALPLGPDELGYDEAEFEAVLDADAEWRQRNPHVTGGPLRDTTGRIVAVPAFMRIDYCTDRNGPIPQHRPELGRCWVWTRGLNKGYAYVRIGKRKVQAYRVNYERWIGPIPPGMLLDHLCRNRACVRPTHLDPTTYSQNTRRSPVHVSVARAARDRCPAGHLFDEANTRWWNGVRYCRACQAARKRQATGAEPRKRATDLRCANGHPWEGNLRILPNGKRQCLTCVRLAGQRFRQRRRDAKAAAAG
jgi:HNH endonuclease